MHLIEAIAILAAVPDQYSTLIAQAIAILAAVPDQYSVLSYLDLRFVALTDSV